MSLAAYNAVWTRSKAQGSARLVMLALADHSDDNGACYPGVERLAAYCNVDSRTVKRHIAALLEQGELLRSNRSSKAGTNEYTLTPGGVRVAPSDSPVGTHVSRPVGTTLSRPVGTHVSPKPSVEPSVEPTSSARARGMVREKLRTAVPQREQWAVSALFNSEQVDDCAWLVDNKLWMLALEFQRRFRPNWPTLAGQLYEARGKGSDHVRSCLQAALMTGKTAGYLKTLLAAAPAAQAAAPVEQAAPEVEAEIARSRQEFDDYLKRMDEEAGL